MAKKKATKNTAAPAAITDSGDGAVGRYVQTAGRIKAGLTRTIKHLRRERRAAQIADRPWYTQAISQLRDEFNEVQADLLAYLDEQLSITPPTDQEVKAITQMADDLDKMIASAQVAKSILIGATKLADSLQS